MDYVLSPAAQADISDIWDYTVKTWGVDQAERYVRAIEARCIELCGAKVPGQSAEHIRPGYRKAGVGRHMMYFRHDDSTLVVIRILHQRMDVDANL